MRSLFSSSPRARSNTPTRRGTTKAYDSGRLLDQAGHRPRGSLDQVRSSALALSGKVTEHEETKEEDPRVELRPTKPTRAASSPATLKRGSAHPIASPEPAVTRSLLHEPQTPLAPGTPPVGTTPPRPRAGGRPSSRCRRAARLRGGSSRRPPTSSAQKAPARPHPKTRSPETGPRKTGPPEMGPVRAAAAPGRTASRGWFSRRRARLPRPETAP